MHRDEAQIPFPAGQSHFAEILISQAKGRAGRLGSESHRTSATQSSGLSRKRFRHDADIPSPINHQGTCPIRNLNRFNQLGIRIYERFLVVKKDIGNPRCSTDAGHWRGTLGGPRTAVGIVHRGAGRLARCPVKQVEIPRARSQNSFEKFPRRRIQASLQNR